MDELTREQILAMPTDVVERVFRQNLSMGKGLGLRSMVQTLQAMVRAVRI